jgi:3-isopropylmalate/(R)-2-methylmalate dehydratase large subunit
MGQTVAEKVIAAKSGQKNARAGDVVYARPDVIMLHEGGTFGLQRPFKELGAQRIAEGMEVVVLLDHYVPAPSVGHSTRQLVTREFAKKMNIDAWYEAGRGGICHQLMPEKGYVRPGELVVGPDAHMTTYGALGALGIGVGFTDVAVILATGKMWTVVPESVKLTLTGRLQKGCSGKDVILAMMGMFGESTLNYTCLEIHGEAVFSLTLEDRLTICNMASELGIKSVAMPLDLPAKEYVLSRSVKPFREVWADEDATYKAEYQLDMSTLEPLIAAPHSPGNIVPVSRVEDVRIDQAFLGSCTNGRISDLRAAAAILKGHKIHPDVRLIVTPASQEVYLQALEEGLVKMFIEMGALFTNPTCGACIGGHMGLLADGETCISASNRNFMGRMGSTKSFIYLSSPEVVAASAITGHITDPRKFM